MAERQRGLGRGLSALIGDTAEAVAADVEARAGVREIPIEQLHPNPDQPRTHFSDDEIAELSASADTTGDGSEPPSRLAEPVFSCLAEIERWRRPRDLWTFIAARPLEVTRRFDARGLGDARGWLWLVRLGQLLRRTL